jgi:hypothetical protein
MAFKDLPTIQLGILPGPKKKWIRKEGNDWMFSLKFFVLFEQDDAELRQQLISIIPWSIKPSPQQLKSLVDEIPQDEGEQLINLAPAPEKG